MATNLGYPRIGPRRELKRALEHYWSGSLGEADLIGECRALRARNWRVQIDLGLDAIPSNDFSLYDHVLDTAVMVGAVPERYAPEGTTIGLKTYFAMARGLQESDASGAVSVPAMELTKWFDTNYHFIVPELRKDQTFRLGSTKPIDEFLEARALGITTRPVILGPVSFLLLSKMYGDRAGSSLELLPALLPVYEEVLGRLQEAGAPWVQLDEPCLALDLSSTSREAFASAYGRLGAAAVRTRLLVAAYFGDLGDNLGMALGLPIHALHLDLVRAPDCLDRALRQVPPSLALSLGVVDGRNIFRADLDAALATLERAVAALGPDRVMVAPSCSLLHVPVDLDLEERMDPELTSWLAFAGQKLREITVLTRALHEGRDAVRADLEAARRALGGRRASPRVHDSAVRARLSAIGGPMLRRGSAYGTRRKKQRARLKLPALPTTTIGSFPQTSAVRKARAEFRAGTRGVGSYEKFLREETKRAITFQEEIGLDVLVHGEFERNDMVEYFGEQLAGFAFTQNGWVQSYGSRCVKPPIIFGDVSRRGPMTVDWSRYAQSLTERPVKGMLTGPVTILQWSFVRDDLPRAVICRQIALAIRDEVADLEAAGLRVIQIDEPAMREGLPLRRERWKAYLDWAIEAFRLASAGASDGTQIHTHMCYSEFNDIIDAVSTMDADVISVEASRSHMELLDSFASSGYPGDIGPGVYDIHSPRVPKREEIEELLRKALSVLRPEQIWVNPDCGLKTRTWDEIRPALIAMVEAARQVRSEVAAGR
ncbi:MAG: 5-methyltetrahydropteroyltriglutamate--homocysteine S-methyltransferase [Gemmatimonadota bacterium]